MHEVGLRIAQGWGQLGFVDKGCECEVNEVGLCTARVVTILPNMVSYHIGLCTARDESIKVSSV